MDQSTWKFMKILNFQEYSAHARAPNLTYTHRGHVYTCVYKHVNMDVSMTF